MPQIRRTIREMAVASSFRRAREDLALCYSILRHRGRLRLSKLDRNTTLKWSETGLSRRTKTHRVGLYPLISRVSRRRYEIKFNKISIKVKIRILRMFPSKSTLHHLPSNNRNKVNFVTNEVKGGNRCKIVAMKISKVMRILMADLSSLSTSIPI